MTKAGRKEDLRVIRTNKMLNEAIFELLKTTSIDKISVVDLCDAAKIHRATFYKHYKDKKGFLKHIISLQLDRLYEEAKGRVSSDDPIEHVRVIAEITIDFAARNRSLLIANVESGEGAGVLGLLASALSREMHYQLGKFAPENRDEKQLEVMSRYLSGGFIYLIGWWISGNTDVTKEELVDQIADLALRNISFLI